MADEAPAQATPEPATSGAATEAPAEANLIDMLEALPAEGEAPEAEATTEGDATPDAKAKPKTDAKDAKPKEESADKKSDTENALDIDEQLFTDEALATKEGVARAAEVAKAAAAAVRERNRILDRYDRRIKKQHEGLKVQRAEHEKTKAADRRALEEEFAPIRQAARETQQEFAILDRRSGATTMQRFEALGRLAGGDGRALYEEWSVGIASDGKLPGPNRNEMMLQAQILQLQQALQQKLQGDESAQATAQLEGLKQGVAAQLAEVRTLANDPEKYPTIAEKASGEDGEEFLADVVEWVKKSMVAAHDAGKPLDKATAIGRVEARLAKLSGARAAAETSAESGTSSKPGSPARGAGKGTTVLPTSADRSTGSLRGPKSQKERDAENLRDPAFTKALPILFD